MIVRKTNKKSKKVIPRIEQLNEEEKNNIYIMFFGPYLNEWRDEKGIVDNTDRTISERLNLNMRLVIQYTNKISTEHFEKITNKYKVKNEYKKNNF